MVSDIRLHMNDLEIKIKLAYITGLRPVVLRELAQYSDINIIGEDADSVYLEFSRALLPKIKQLRSVARAYLVLQDSRYHPAYISNHKSILSTLIDGVIEGNERDFASFKISCAGSDSPEVKSIVRYVQEMYGLNESEEADVKIHIVKPEEIWEVGIQITPRPLSVREYRVVNMSGAMDPTVAFAVNSLGSLEKSESYLNIFSGSATLLIEAGQCYPNIKKLIGFDNNKKHLSLSVQNIKKAGLITKVQLKEADIFDNPDFGTFDTIVSDLPFGMAILKNEDLETLYKVFVEYCEHVLDPNGKLVVYTSEHDLLEPIVRNSKFTITDTLELKFITSVNAYLRPKIILCEFKAN